MSDIDPSLDPPKVLAEPVGPARGEGLAHLLDNQRLIVRRALLASALRSFLPVPGMDESLAGKVGMGLYVKLAASRNVDLAPESAAVLGRVDQGPLSTTMKVMSAATMLARFAGRKLFALLAAGRGAAEMAKEFQAAILFDHYCARIHVGGAIPPARARVLRAAMDHAVSQISRDALTRAFQEGSSTLGHTLLESPRWFANELSALAERFLRSGGNPDVAAAMGETFREGEAAWLDRATGVVEEALSRMGEAHWDSLVRAFESRIIAARED
jgi:hypothetical protein